MKTRAAILYKLHSPLALEDVEVPELKHGQVLVKILWSGVCRSQLNEIDGFKGKDRYLPHLLGHEGSGVVEKVGPGVTKVKKKDYVVLSWLKGKGIDVGASQYQQGRRIINSGAISTFSQHSVISENRLTRISPKIPTDVAALLGCAVPTGAGVIFHQMNLEKRSSIAVFGVGGIGASAILAARMRGCQNIIAIDISSAKLQFAKKLGATHSFLFQDKNLFSKIRKITPLGVDYSLEASGKATAMEMAFEVLSSQGKAVIAGNLKQGEKIQIDPFDLIKGKIIMGSWGGEAQLDDDVLFLSQAYLRGKLPLERLITHRFKLEQINQAFEFLKNSKAGRILINCS